jgi:hypothetical protein
MDNKKESLILNDIRLAASDLGFVLFRNNVGTGWCGDVTRLADGSVLIRNPRPLHAGLCKGSSDLIGFRPLVITAEHLGTTIAQFAAVEVKTARGRVSQPQQQFLTVVAERGGLGIVARGPGDIA